jgi:hypothetical protein
MKVQSKLDQLIALQPFLKASGVDPSQLTMGEGTEILVELSRKLDEVMAELAAKKFVKEE